MRSNSRCIHSVPLHPIQPVEHFPTRLQGRVDVHSPKESIDRARSVAQGDVAVPALLMEPAKPRMMFLEPLQHRERFGYAPEVAQCECDQVQNVAILGHLERKCLTDPQRLLVLASIEQLAGTANAVLYGGWRGVSISRVQRQSRANRE